MRLEAIQALCNVPSAQAVAIGMRALDQSTDPFIDFALKKLAILHKARWQPEFAAGRLTFDGNARHTAFALKAIGGEAVPILVGLVEKGQVPQENLTGILQLIALMGNPGDQASALRQLLAPGHLAATDKARVLEALAQAARERHVRPSGELDGIASLFADGNTRLGSAALTVAGLWKHGNAARAILAWASNPKAAELRRAAAMQALVDLGGPRSLEQIEHLTSTSQPHAIRLQAIAGLASMDLAKAARHAGELLRQAPSADQDPGSLFAAFLGRKGGALRFGESSGAATTLDRRRQDRPARSRRARHAGAGAQRRAPKSPGPRGRQTQARRAGHETLDRAVQSQGDAARGEAVFRRRHARLLPMPRPGRRRRPRRPRSLRHRHQRPA